MTKRHEEGCPRCMANLQVDFDEAGPSEPYAANPHFTAFPGAIESCPWCKVHLTLISLNSPDVDGNTIYRLCDTKWDLVEERHYARVNKWTDQVEDLKQILADDSATEKKKARAKEQLPVLEERIATAQAAFDTKEDDYFQKKMRWAERIDKRMEKGSRVTKASGGGGCALPVILAAVGLLLFGVALAAPSPADSTAGDTPRLIPTPVAAATQDSAAAGDSLQLVSSAASEIPETPGQAESGNLENPTVIVVKSESQQPEKRWWELMGSWMWPALGTMLATVVGVLLQHRLQRKDRAEAKFNERRVELLGEAYGKMKEIQGWLVQASDESVLQFLELNEPWLMHNRIYLPGAYPELWLQIRNAMMKVVRTHQANEAGRQPELTPPQVTNLQGQMEQWAADALLEVYKEAPGLKPLNPMSIDPGPSGP